MPKIDFKKYLTFAFTHLGAILAAYRHVESLARIIVNRGEPRLSPQQKEDAGVAEFLRILRDAEGISEKDIPADLEAALGASARDAFRATANIQNLLAQIRAAQQGGQ